MKKALIILLTILISGCSASVNEKKVQNKKQYEVVEVPIIIDSDTTYINDLRFNKIKSSRDTMKMMYEGFGNWDQKLTGKYQDNINQIVWKNIDLLNNDERFTIITDGKETMEDYFASIMIFDSKNNDCLQSSHPLMDKLI